MTRAQSAGFSAAGIAILRSNPKARRRLLVRDAPWWRAWPVAAGRSGARSLQARLLLQAAEHRRSGPSFYNFARHLLLVLAQARRAGGFNTPRLP